MFAETWLADAVRHCYKVVSFVQNALTPEGTQDTEQENVIKVFKENKNNTGFKFVTDNTKKCNDDILYEFGN